MKATDIKLFGAPTASELTDMIYEFKKKNPCLKEIMRDEDEYPQAKMKFQAKIWFQKVDNCSSPIVNLAKIDEKLENMEWQLNREKYLYDSHNGIYPEELMTEEEIDELEELVKSIRPKWYEWPSIIFWVVLTVIEVIFSIILFVIGYMFGELPNRGAKWVKSKLKI